MKAMKRASQHRVTNILIVLISNFEHGFHPSNPHRHRRLVLQGLGRRLLPSGMQRRKEHPLEYLAQCFDMVEINTSFYGHIKPELAKLWARR